MSLDRATIKAVIFDYGNTLIEFTRPHVDRLDAAIGGAIREQFGAFDTAHYRQMRDAGYRAPYFHPDLREPPLTETLGRIVRELHGVEADVSQLDLLDAAHHEAFVAAIEAPAYVTDLLDRLRERYTLALISNYPCAKSIRASLDATGIAPHLDAVVVSGEVGHVKPHPVLFERVLDDLGVGAGEAVYVGDNWLGDVQGAKRIGMAAVHIRQFDTLEVFDREDGHHDADGVIEHLTDIEAWLAG